MFVRKLNNVLIVIVSFVTVRGPTISSNEHSFLLTKSLLIANGELKNHPLYLLGYDALKDYLQREKGRDVVVVCWALCFFLPIPG
jgi:hypothetical protein